MFAQFVITLREGMEAALAIAIVAAYLRKIKRNDLGKYLWLGSGLAVLASAFLSMIFWTFYGYAESYAGLWFEAISMFTAAAMLTYMVFWMAKNARKVKGELQEKVDVAISSGQLLGISGLAFTSVLREGAETILFLSAAATISFTETIIGATLGLFAASLVAFFIMRGTVRLDWRKFFMYTSILLILFASGITMHGAKALQELGVLPSIVERVYDLSSILPEDGPLGSVLHVFFGYHDAPSLLLLLVQFGYLAIFGSYVREVYRKTRIKQPALLPKI
jgi:high-affinity iron transporter